MPAKPTNIVIAGLGGQGVLKASDMLADALFLAGHDVKKSEIHGMSQRGGSVRSDVRFGERVDSPMVPAGEADYLVVQAMSQVEVHRPCLCAAGVLLAAELVDEAALPSRKSLNVALLGVLSRHVTLPPECWHEAIRRNLDPKLHAVNLQAFDLGREAQGR
ncbi:MAG: 2-oxoacid:acceptor oxidoreductase family protein [Armatimonadetes bacterium]|nr:2-oxoacid:acceptor oxidoreductase family protein [Armatimonadota bacterium]